MKTYSYVLRLTEVIAVDDMSPPGVKIDDILVDKFAILINQDEIADLMARCAAWVAPTPAEIALRDRLTYAFNMLLSQIID